MEELKVISKISYENTTWLNEYLGVEESFDIGFRKFEIGKINVYIYYITGLCDTDYLIEIFKNLLLLDEIDKEDVFAIIKNNIVHQQVANMSNLYELAKSVLSGLAGILIEGETTGLVVDVRNYPGRGPAEPDTERVVRGSRDGFTENIIVNTALTRRRIKDGKLRFEMYKIGNKTETDVCFAYIKDVAKEELVNEVRARLQNVKIDELSMSDKELEELITKQGFNPYPKVRYTERPDIVSVHLYQGLVAVFVDTSPSVILAPTTFFDHIQHAEEYRQTALSGTFIRVSRFAGIFASIFLVPVWFLFAMNPQYLPDFLWYIGPNEVGNVPLIWQFIIAEIGVEFLRTASIHTPASLSTAMGIIAGIIIGQIAIEVGLFTPEVVLYTAISAVGAYATPSYELALANKISKIVFIIAIYFFGLYGLIGSVSLWVIFLASNKTFKKPYLYPLIPLNITDFFKVLIRFPYRNNK